ncbi:MAG TPA: hypothetical protein VE890_06460 [Thermoguttaceae bacterium]|nr:hypothetical protein [Thermoguttaceae bacterium]
MENHIRQTTHVDYAEEAESAQRARAWPQAAKLWQKAIDMADERHDYARHLKECKRRIAIDGQLESIARRLLRIETLASRKADHLDFPEVAVWALQDALRAAYDAGYNAKK